MTSGTVPTNRQPDDPHGRRSPSRHGQREPLPDTETPALALRPTPRGGCGWVWIEGPHPDAPRGGAAHRNMTRGDSQNKVTPASCGNCRHSEHGHSARWRSPQKTLDSRSSLTKFSCDLPVNFGTSALSPLPKLLPHIRLISNRCRWFVYWETRRSEDAM